MVACSLVAGLLLQGIGSRVTEVADASLQAEPHEAQRAPAPAPASAPDGGYRIAAGK